ncbi:DUF5687 family protein [Salinibacter altiplanensis]|uniref:DUF5687 family protein n=1 Tax=Salinibacter altiplanensis TaxID=1803181 RepID=UPI001E53247B|nr:DUF5687 family protein [Salinibacter altiplanensis]
MMPFWKILRHRLRAYRRVPFFGRRALSLLLRGFLALYLGGGLVLFGLFFDDLVRAVAPGADPLLVASQGLLPFALVYAAVRVFVESGVGVDLRPYLPLPLRRSVLAGVAAVLALLSLWNAVPLAFVATVCVEAALGGALGPALRFGLVSMGVLAAVTYAVPMLRQTVQGRPVLAAVALLLAVGAAALEWVDAAGGLASLLDVSGWLLGGAVAGRTVPIAATTLLIGGVGTWYVRWVQGEMVLDCGTQPTILPGASSTRLDQLARRGPAWQEAVLQVRRYLRNKQLRVSIFVLPVMVGSLAVVGYATDSVAELHSGLIHLLVVGLFGTGHHIIQGGPNLFSYEGEQLDALQSRPVSIQDRMQGRWVFLALGALVPFALPLPVMLWTWSPFVIFHTAFFLYNIGVVAPVMLAASAFTRTPVDPNQHSMAISPGMAVVRAALMLPALGLPVLLLFLLDDLVLSLGLIGGLGLLSAAAAPLWRRVLVALYRRNRHAMMRGFRTSRS